MIRRESESEALLRVERQFVSMTVAVGVTVGLLLSCKIVMEHRTKEFIHNVDQYFICLLVSQVITWRMAGEGGVACVAVEGKVNIG